MAARSGARGLSGDSEARCGSGRGSRVRAADSGRPRARCPNTGRALRRSPDLRLLFVLTASAGHRGHTAIFSVVDQVLLRPLPYPNGDQLMAVYEGPPGIHWPSAGQLARLAARSGRCKTWRSGARRGHTHWVGEPVRLNTTRVLRILSASGVAPILGPTVSRKRPPNAPLVPS